MGVVAIPALLIGGCGTPAGGDPGGKRFHELVADPVFVALPPGSTRLDVTRTRARYRQPDFTAGGWQGPSVVIRFTNKHTPADVFEVNRHCCAGTCDLDLHALKAACEPLWVVAVFFAQLKHLEAGEHGGELAKSP